MINKMSKKAKVVSVIVVLAIALVCVVFFTTPELNVFASPNQGSCKLPENSPYVPVEQGFYSIEETDVKVFIVRGIAMGGPLQSGQSDVEDVAPRCFSEDKDLVTVKNLHLVDESGNRLALLKGVANRTVVPAGENPLP